jgi:hypothetical protein
MAGKVLCVSPSGHFAIELSHEGKKCPAAERGPHGKEQGERGPCYDIVLGSRLAAHGGDRAAPQVKAPVAADSVLGFCPAVPTFDEPVTVPPGIADALAPPRLPPDRIGLSTVVLLI